MTPGRMLLKMSENSRREVILKMRERYAGEGEKGEAAYSTSYVSCAGMIASMRSSCWGRRFRQREEKFEAVVLDRNIGMRKGWW
mgnify:CR=1 FL=1